MLVDQRMKWECDYFFGKEPWFPAFLEYKKNRRLESFRLNAAMEEFFEYVICLEEEVKYAKAYDR